MNNTLQSSLSELQSSLREYIEATYHISDPRLVFQRRALLETLGVIYQRPFVESTPRYKDGARFADIPKLPEASRLLLSALSTPTPQGNRLFYDPPRKHQAQSLQYSLADQKNLLIMTGTGSGKTESFLMPILGKLAKEAKESPEVFREQDAMRALVLYPMNALVNDQLGRLRLIFGDKRMTSLFNKWSARPARFARYTSRTPYAGVRSAKKDPRKLGSIEAFYVAILNEINSDDLLVKERAERLLKQLTARGKWPAKPDIRAWYGKPKSHWQDRHGKFLRAVLMPDDAEEITRHEVLEDVPDLLVTNYSMLEYMLMRPVERPIFDKTKAWLAKNPEEKFLLVVDEAHLYKGAAGAEVALLIRRLRDRLDIGPERLSVICATASFTNQEKACEFGAGLTGVAIDSFVPIVGDIDERAASVAGSFADVDMLISLDLEGVYGEVTADRYNAISKLLKARKVDPTGNLEADLFKALDGYGPLNMLINETMRAAWDVSELGSKVFPGALLENADLAVSNLMALASLARLKADQASLLPCRAHSFFRGLPGLWVCLDKNCKQVPEEQRNGICGQMYAQPNDNCDCGAIVLPLFTCRLCGAAYARGYVTDIEDPKAVWPDAGMRLRIDGVDLGELKPIDLLLEKSPHDRGGEQIDLDLLDGQINPDTLHERHRAVWINYFKTESAATGDDDDHDTDPGEIRGRLFQPCGICQRPGRRGSSVQDHETKGDEPFQALVSRQLQIQAPSLAPATKFAPLRGRKVLAFSDSRQVAARLAPRLQTYSTRDALRPLMVYGWKRLSEVSGLRRLNLNDLFLAVLAAANKLDVRLRPELRTGENFNVDATIHNWTTTGKWESDDSWKNLREDIRYDTWPQALVGDVLVALQDRLTGLQALAIGTIAERSDLKAEIVLFPVIKGLAETPEQKIALTRAWLRCWHGQGFHLLATPPAFCFDNGRGRFRIKAHDGKFRGMNNILSAPTIKKAFETQWLPTLLAMFTMDGERTKRILKGDTLALELFGEWARCNACRAVQRPNIWSSCCIECGQLALMALAPDTDESFIARKGFFRRPILGVLGATPQPPLSFVAAEHTAQLNSAQTETVFSKAEENELLFQDIELSTSSKGSTAIDVLSSTTTMEVGIDIGALSGVALRNMPPGRANYQQRSGRAGRRGNAIATVVAYGGTDTHDEHYFSKPELMIRGPVPDPILTLNNPEIARRHVRAFLIQNYHQVRTVDIDPQDAHTRSLFSVLGTVDGFRQDSSILNRADFASWLDANKERMHARIDSWLPIQLVGEVRQRLIEESATDCLGAIDAAIDYVAPATTQAGLEGAQPPATIGPHDQLMQMLEESETPEVPPEMGEDKPIDRHANEELLGWLLYKGVLPRYAFPTDVATFYVFDQERSTAARPVAQFAPSQSLPVALSQYAPGKQIWISNRCYTSGAIFSPMRSDRKAMWKSKKLYMECSNCGYADTRPIDDGVALGDKLRCMACGLDESLGPARHWIRPVGFAHPVFLEAVTSPEDVPETSYATRAKLTMPTPPEKGDWHPLAGAVRVLTASPHLLVSNTGPKSSGYTYCLSCGRIESTVTAGDGLNRRHELPYVDANSKCSGKHDEPNIVLGTDFITDVALMSFRVKAPVQLRPGNTATEVALRTLSEALARQACAELQIDFSEIMAEFRPAINTDGVAGLEAEIFLYDTLSGGAGFCKQLPSIGHALLGNALSLLKECRGNCDSSCYRCLRNFRNKIDHSVLDRHLGAWLLEHALTGELPIFNASRLEKSTNRLFEDLIRQKITGIKFHRDVKFSLPTGGSVQAPIAVERGGSLASIIGLTVPLANTVFADAALRAGMVGVDAAKAILIDELVVQKSLAKATEQVLSRI